MWGPVLLELEKYNRTVTAGRVGDVGVGGLLLGGGLSFYTGYVISGIKIASTDSDTCPNDAVSGHSLPKGEDMGC